MENEDAMTLPSQRPRLAECGCDIEEHDPGCNREPIPVPRETLEQFVRMILHLRDWSREPMPIEVRAALASLTKLLEGGR